MDNTTLQGVQLTGNEAVDQEKQTLAGLEAQLTELRKTNPALFTVDQQQDTRPAPIEITVGGRKVVFESTDQLQTALEGMNTYVQQLEQQARTPQGQAPSNPVPVTEEYSDDKFAELLKSGGTKAALSYFLENSEVLQETRQLKAKISQLEAEKALERVAAANQERNPQNLQKLQEIARAGGFDLSNPIQLQAAYALGRQQGIIVDPNAAQNTPAFNPQNPYPAPPRPVVPPTMGRTTFVDPNASAMYDQFESLPLDQQARILEQMQRGGR